MNSDFYCKIHAHITPFDIPSGEFNQEEESMISQGIPEKTRDKILFPDKCESQCIDCACIVGERRLRTKKIGYILKLDFYDLCGISSLTMSDKDKIKYFEERES